MRAAGDLGDEVRVTVERGARSFASGDRVMFLQNERGLGVKNGTLGTIEQVSAQSMTVRTDDGRSVASTSRTTTGSTMAMPRPSTRRRA